MRKSISVGTAGLECLTTMWAVARLIRWETRFTPSQRTKVGGYKYITTYFWHLFVLVNSWSSPNFLLTILQRRKHTFGGDAVRLGAIANTQ